ncbi:MAG: zinc ribbon domain-containing protein [Dermatophilaceae bacterium]
MTSNVTCDSCAMPIESGRYCTNCTDSAGNLQSFDERFRRMTGWQARHHPETTPEQIEQQTREYMATMPAWRDHPRLTQGTP